MLSNSAEMVPHYRPASWNVTYLQKIGHSTLVRVSGQLMYDGPQNLRRAGLLSHDNPSGCQVGRSIRCTTLRCARSSQQHLFAVAVPFGWVASPAAKARPLKQSRVAAPAERLPKTSVTGRERATMIITIRATSAGTRC